MLTVLSAKRATCDNINHRLFIFILLTLRFAFSYFEHINGIYTTNLLLIKWIMIYDRSQIISSALKIRAREILLCWWEVCYQFFFCDQIYIFLFNFFISHFYSGDVLLGVKVYSMILFFVQFIDYDCCLLPCWYFEGVFSCWFFFLRNNF